MFRFVEEKEGLGFAEAVEALAERNGVELERENEDPRAEESEAPEGAPRGAARADGEVLRALPVGRAEGEEGARLPAGRGLGEEVLRRFGVGMAPSAWDQVLTREPAGRLQASTSWSPRG